MPGADRRSSKLPAVPAAVLRALLPIAERDEVLADLAAEFAELTARDGAFAARLWCWRQVARSLPALLRRSWWRGMSGFEPDANRTRPGGPSMENWIIDVRYALRVLVRRPLYLVLSVFTLALGVGGTAAIYSVARRVLLDPLPYTDENRLALFWMPFDWTEQEFAFLRGRIPGFSQ